MKNISLEFRKQLSASVLKHLKETQPGLTPNDLCCVASTFYNDCLAAKKEQPKVERTPLTYGRKKK